MAGLFDNKRLSFEFFPPQTDKGREKLKTTRERLNALNPEFFSVTYGAGGSTRDNTQGVVFAMREEGLDVAPHLSFGGDDEETMEAYIKAYQEKGVNRIVALRGDVLSGTGGSRPAYANELVSFIRQRTGDHFTLEVAAYPEIHPESTDYNSDIRYLKLKLDAGGDNAITQYFYNTDAYFQFVDACSKAGIDKPIVPGVMPIINFTNLKRFSAKSGAEIPQWLCRRIEAFGDDQDSIQQFGIEFVTRLCERLLEGGAPGIHFYTMNQYEPTATIVGNLR